MPDVTLQSMRNFADDALVNVAAGASLSALEQALVAFGLAVSVTSLDPASIDSTLSACVGAGATAAQLQEVVSLISGLGVHSLMMSSARILAATSVTELGLAAPLTPEQQALWDKHVGSDPFWIPFERELPGFLDGMLRLSSEQFAAFFEYCAVPWTSGTVRARLKELIAMGSDATPTHRFMPGFRLHLANAIKLGAGSTAIHQTLDIAAKAAIHRGTA